MWMCERAPSFIVYVRVNNVREMCVRIAFFASLPFLGRKFQREWLDCKSKIVEFSSGEREKIHWLYLYVQCSVCSLMLSHTTIEIETRNFRMAALYKCYNDYYCQILWRKRKIERLSVILWAPCIHRSNKGVYVFERKGDQDTWCQLFTRKSNWKCIPFVNDKRKY